MPEGPFTCSRCDQERLRDNLVYRVTDTIAYCDNCASLCRECSEPRINDDMREIDGQMYCSNCATICERCGEAVRYCDAWAIYGDSGDYVCEDCRDEAYSCCRICDQLVHNDDLRTAYDEQDETEIEICESCAESDSRVYVDDDDNLIFTGGRRMPQWPTGPQIDPNRIFQDYYNLEGANHRCPHCNKEPEPCSSCLEIQARAKKQEELTLWIYDTQLGMYHQSEHRRFKSTPYRMPHEHPYLYYGIELEVVFNNKANKQKVVHDFIIATGGLFVAEYDSSVDRVGNGAEFISRPLSYKAWTSHNIKDKLSKGFKILEEAGANINQPLGCGLHVHMSMVFFEHNTKKNVKDIKSDIDWFFQVFQKEIEMISDRPYTQYCFAKKDRIKERLPSLSRDQGINLKMTLERGGLPSVMNDRDNHHYAIVATEKTIEVRTFRSTLEVDRIIATIQFCRAIAHAARNMKITEETTFNDIISCKEGDELTALVHGLKLDTSKKFKTTMEI